MRVIRRLLARLVAVVVLSPIALLVILALGALLRGLDDRVGAATCGRLVLIGGVVWFVGVMGMALLTAVLVLAEPPAADGHRCRARRGWGRGGWGRRRHRPGRRGEPSWRHAERDRQRGEPSEASGDG